MLDLQHFFIEYHGGFVARFERQTENTVFPYEETEVDLCPRNENVFVYLAVFLFLRSIRSPCSVRLLMGNYRLRGLIEERCTFPPEKHLGYPPPFRNALAFSVKSVPL